MNTRELLALSPIVPVMVIDDAAAVFARTVLSDEGQEGTGAFMQKRTPNWVTAPTTRSPSTMRSSQACAKMVRFG